MGRWPAHACQSGHQPQRHQLSSGKTTKRPTRTRHVARSGPHLQAGVRQRLPHHLADCAYDLPVVARITRRRHCPLRSTTPTATLSARRDNRLMRKPLGRSLQQQVVTATGRCHSDHATQPEWPEQCRSTSSAGACRQLQPLLPDIASPAASMQVPLFQNPPHVKVTREQQQQQQQRWCANTPGGGGGGGWAPW